MRLTSGGGGAGAALRTRAGSAAALPTGSGPRAGSTPDEEMGGAGLSVDASGAGAGAGASSGRLTVDSRRGSVGSLKASIACPMNRMARTVITATTPVTSHIVRDPTCRGLSRSSPNRASRCLGLGILGRVMWGFAIWRSDMRGRLSLSRRRSATSAPAPNPPRPASSSDSSRASSANSLCTAGFGTRRSGHAREEGRRHASPRKSRRASRWGWRVLGIAPGPIRSRTPARGRHRRVTRHEVRRRTASASQDSVPAGSGHAREEGRRARRAGPRGRHAPPRKSRRASRCG